jgi:hypothetical protein
LILVILTVAQQAWNADFVLETISIGDKRQRRAKYDCDSAGQTLVLHF